MHIPPKAEYYLHTNKSLLYKPHGGVDVGSPFVIKKWSAKSIGQSPSHFLDFLLELKSLKADMVDVVNRFPNEIKYMQDNLWDNSKQTFKESLLN